ncbi:MAG: hypothetical protein U0800_27250 [Isosphaeraceae bacterium]
MPPARHRTDLRNVPIPNLNIPASQQQAVERRHALDQQQRDYRNEPNGSAQLDPRHWPRRPPG